MSKELFINYMRGKGVEPTQRDVDHFIFMAKSLLEDLGYGNDGLGLAEPADSELTRLRKRVETLEAALNDQLNDCINFDGGKLTDIIMEKSTAILRGGGE